MLKFSESTFRLAIILTISVLSALLLSKLHPQREELQWHEVPSIAFKEAAPLKPLWIDARSQSDFLSSHLPGATNLEEGHWDEGFSKIVSLIKPNSIVVVYCSSGSCSTSREVAIRLKRELGLQSIYTLKGGFEAWQTARK